MSEISIRKEDIRIIQIESAVSGQYDVCITFRDNTEKGWRFPCFPEANEFYKKWKVDDKQQDHIQQLEADKRALYKMLKKLHENVCYNHKDPALYNPSRAPYEMFAEVKELLKEKE